MVLPIIAVPMKNTFHISTFFLSLTSSSIIASEFWYEHYDFLTAAVNKYFFSSRRLSPLKSMLKTSSSSPKIFSENFCAFVDQRNVKRKFIGYGLHRKTLPHFVIDDLGSRGWDFVVNSFLWGNTPTQFSFMLWVEWNVYWYSGKCRQNRIYLETFYQS